MFGIDVDSFLKNHIVFFGFSHLLDGAVGTLDHNLLLFIFTGVQVFLELTALALKLPVLFDQLLLTGRALDDTVIENGVKLDNLIQIGHNVHIGAHTAMAGCVGVAGSATIGAHCTVGGGAVVLGHLSLADHVHISAASVVTRSILQPGQYTGMFPLDSNANWEKNAASLKQLARLRERIKALESEIQNKKETRP